MSRDTKNALSTLGKIFDKSTIEEQQELAKVFGEEAYRLAHNMKDDGSARKIAVHAAIGGIMSQITGSGFTSGAIGAGVNEAVIKEISKIKDPGTAQIVSGIVGAAVAKVAGGNTGAGATVAASGTKNNQYGYRRYIEGEVVYSKWQDGVWRWSIVDDNGNDVFINRPPAGVYAWIQDPENPYLGYDYKLGDQVNTSDVYFSGDIKYQYFKVYNGKAYGFVLKDDSDWEKRESLKRLGKMYVEAVVLSKMNPNNYRGIWGYEHWLEENNMPLSFKYGIRFTGEIAKKIFGGDD